MAIGYKPRTVAPEGGPPTPKPTPPRIPGRGEAPYRVAQGGPPAGERRISAGSFEPEVYLGGKWYSEKSLTWMRLDHRLHELPEEAKMDLANLAQRDRIFRVQMGAWHPSLLGESPDEDKHELTRRKLEGMMKRQKEWKESHPKPPPPETPPARRLTFWQRIVWAFTRRVPWLPTARVKK